MTIKKIYERADTTRKTFLLLTLLTITLTPCLFADGANFQIRQVLSEEEAKTIPHDTFPYAQNGREMNVLVSRDAALTAEDVQDASIRLQADLLKEFPDELWTINQNGEKEMVLRYTEQDKLNLTAEPRIDFNLTESGKQKWADFTGKMFNKQAAVIGNNIVYAQPFIRDKITNGKLQIFSPTENVNEMVKLVEGMGLKLKARPEEKS